MSKGSGEETTMTNEEAAHRYRLQQAQDILENSMIRIKGSGDYVRAFHKTESDGFYPSKEALAIAEMVNILSKRNADE